MVATLGPEAIVALIATVAREELGFDGKLELESPLVEVLRLDSIRMLTLVTELENRLEVCFDPGDELALVTVGDLVALVEARRG